jgi:hypothetical protein
MKNDDDDDDLPPMTEEELSRVNIVPRVKTLRRVLRLTQLLIFTEI